jgi:polysaccharide pyruvyl transferase CsaB
MRVVVSGYYGYGNAGDESVLAGLLDLLRAEEPDIAVTVLSGDPAHTRRTHDVDAIARANPAAVIRALRASAGLISGGGSLLQDRTSPRPVAYYAGLMHLARVLRRPYVVHAQGLGPITRRANRALAGSALRGAAHVSLRDPDSLALAREIGVRRPIQLVPDPALALHPPASGRGGHVLVAVRSWGASTQHLAGLRDALRSLSAERTILALPMQDAVDRQASEAAIDGIHRAEVLGPGASLDEQLAAIGSASLVVGMRLHALILAAAAGVPALAISYDPKVDAFAAEAGHPVVGEVGRAIDATALVAAAHAALAADPAPYRERVERLRAQLPASVAASLAALRAAGQGHG